MKEAKFKIGDRVKTTAVLCEGNVKDCFMSPTSGWMYEVATDHGMEFYFREEDLELKLPVKEFSMDIKIDIANNVVIATLYESAGGAQKPIGKGHGHLIHEGEVGIAQAASYACMRLYKSIGGKK